jgi:hypothetical protein
MDWVIAQKGLLFDVLMFIISCMMNKSVRGCIPFALTLLSHHVPEEQLAEAQAYIQEIGTKLYLNMQSDDDFESPSSINDPSLNDWYAKFQGSETWQGLKKLYVYVVCLILHGPARCRERDIERAMKECSLALLENTGNVIYNIIKITKSLFTNFFQCVRSGRWSDFFHSESTYDKWFNDNLEVERAFAQNIIPNDAHDLITKTELLLKQGKEMIEQMRGISGAQKQILAINARYLRTYELFNKFMGVISATELRRTPFCLQVTGKSKIGKTSFMYLNHNLYASLFHKDPEIQPYIRQSADRFWDAHKPNQWSIIFDDVCAHNPNVIMGVDEFHKDVIHIHNNIAKMAECASLEDKGSHPVLVDLSQITTNVPHLHAGVYFYDTAALFRRLQHRVTLVLKPCYKGDDGFLDPSKIPQTDAFPDLWFISIEKAITKPYGGGEPDREQGCWVEVPELKDLSIWEYMKWFKQATSDHVEDQNKFLHNMRKLRETVMCQSCGLPMANHPEGDCVFTTYFQSDADWEAAPTEEVIGYPEDWDTASSSSEDIPLMEEVIMQTDDAPEDDRLVPLTWAEWASDHGAIVRRGLIHWFARSVIFSADFVARTERRNRESHIFQLILSFVQFVYSFVMTRCVFFFLCQIWWPLGLPMALFCMLMISPTYWANQLGLQITPYVLIAEGFVQLWAASTLQDTARMVRIAGRTVFNYYGGTPLMLQIIGILVAGIAVLYILLKSLMGNSEGKRHDRIIQQGQMVSNLRHGNEPENVWRMHDYKCNVLDVPNPSSSLKNADELTIVSYFHRFLIRLKVKWNMKGDNSILRVTGGTGILLGGQKILFPTHFFFKPTGAESMHSVTVLYSTRQNNTREATCVVDRFSYDEFDDQMSILTFPAMPAQRAIKTTIPAKEMLNFVGPGLRIGRGKDGSVFVDRIKRINNVRMSFGNHWQAGTGADAVTQLGDCGALLLALTPSGPVLVGVHLWLDCFDSTNKVSYSYNLCGRDFGKLISDAPPKLDKLEKVGELGVLHPKSPIQFLDDLGGMQVFGSFSGFRTSVKSKVVETIGAPYLKDTYGFVHTHGPPVMRGREVKFLHLQSFKRTNARVSEYQAELACAVLLQHALNHSDDWRVYQISQHDAVNGVPGVRFVDRIPITTSCGFPYKTPKYNKITPVVDGDWTSELIVDDDIQSDIDFVLDRWRNRKRACPVFTAALKDEPRKFSKIQSKSTRIFYGGPAGLIIAERMVFTWFTRLVQTNPLVFMQAPGMDATGSQWDCLYKWMWKSDNWIAGDFKEFDISMIIQFLRMSYKFIILLAKHLEADPDHILMMEAASEDLINPMVDYFGDLIMGTGKNPSGHALTVIINGLVNAFYMIHCYLVLDPKGDTNNRWSTLKLGENFFRDVRAMFYGDDNIMNVSDSAPWFNHTAISQYLKSVDVTYTMADKDRESVPYVKGTDITFLKRSFRFEPEVGGYVAPLDITSVHKALMLTIPSKVVSKEKAYMDCIVSQNDTMWHHGKKAFEEFQVILNDLIEHLNLGEYMVRPLLTYDELSARWIQTRSNPENIAWDPERKSFELQSSQDVEAVEMCDRCGQCPYIDLMDMDYAPCRLCGGCTFGGDPWCIVCQEDGFCSCGELFDFSVMVNRGTLKVTILLACGDCDNFKLKSVPLTRILANSHGIPWSTVSHT